MATGLRTATHPWRLLGGLFLLVMLVHALAAPAAMGQVGSTGGLRGIVRDETAGALAGVTVEAASPARIGGAAVAVTDGDGRYVFDNLPIGIYAVTFSLSGFTTVKREDIRVESGRSIELTQNLALGTMEETLTVQGQTPVVDVANAGMSTNFNKQMLDNIPSSRSQFFDVLAAVPGVQNSNPSGGANPAIFGSTSNVITYDGVDVMAPGGSTFDYPNYDMMQEFEVQGIGASAEQTGFQGGAINIVLRSGSNQYKGSGSFYGSWNALLANNTPNERFPVNMPYAHDFNFAIGGPVKKDRLWFQYINQNIRRKRTGIGQDPQFAQTVRIWRPFVKANAKLSSRDNVSFSYNDCRDWWPSGGSIESPIETTQVEVGSDPVFTSTWTHMFGNATMLSTKGGGIYVFKWNPPVMGDFVTPGHQDVGTGINSVNVLSFTRWRRRHLSIESTLAHTTNNFITGLHEFKGGVQIHTGEQVTDTAWPSNTQYTDNNGAPYEMSIREPILTGGHVRTNGFFVQDTWSATSRLTFNLGVRYDSGVSDIQAMQQMDSLLQNQNGIKYDAIPDLINLSHFSPRLGATVKLDEAGSTVVKFSGGRYFRKMTATDASSQAPGALVSQTFGWNPATSAYDILKRTEVPSNNNIIDPDLTNEYTDQFHVGLERQLAPNFGVNVMGIYKREKNKIGTIDPASVYVPQTYTDTFDGQTTQFIVYNRITPASASRLLKTNLPGLKQSYKSFLVEANKRMSGNWQAQISYQWQREREDFVPTTGDPNQSVNGYGRASTDNTHAVRGSVVFDLGHGFTLGTRYFFNSGFPYARIVTVRGLGQGNPNVNAEPIGAYKYPSTNEWRFRLDKAFSIARGNRLRLALDVLNAFNIDAATNVRNNSSQTTYPFGTLFSVIEGRRAQIAIRYEFN